MTKTSVGLEKTILNWRILAVHACLTTPTGLTLLLIWRNHRGEVGIGTLYDFPFCEVDVGLSTHAHFDHDNLHSIHASVLLDRLMGRFEFADFIINGFADKHVSDSKHNKYDWAGLTQKLTPMEANAKQLALF